jgi:hypothetical protein
VKATYDFRGYTGKEPSGANLSSGLPMSFGDSLPNTHTRHANAAWTFSDHGAAWVTGSSSAGWIEIANETEPVGHLEPPSWEAGGARRTSLAIPGAGR